MIFECFQKNFVEHGPYEVTNRAVQHQGVCGTLIQQPLNVATDLGGDIFFNCTSNTANPIVWIYTKDGNIGGSNVIYLTENQCTIRSQYTTNFKTEKPVGGNVCNLILFNAKLSHGGFYTCNDGIGDGTSSSHSILAIIDSNSQNFHYNATDVILPKEDLQISKTVTYGGPSLNPPVLPPSFYWTLQSDTTRNITSNQSQTTNTSSSYIIVTAQPPTVPIYVCNLFFNSPVNPPPACAVNPPLYRFNWPTKPIQVAYPPAIESVTHECLEKELMLNCLASGHPSPNYTWTNLEDNVVISNASQTLISYGYGLYRCNATNEIKGIIYSSFQDVNATNCKYCPPTTECSVCDKTAAIVLGVLFAISFLVNVGFVIWVIFRLIQNQAEPDKSDSRRVSAPEFSDVTAMDPQGVMYESLSRTNTGLSTGQNLPVYQGLTTNSGLR